MVRPPAQVAYIREAECIGCTKCIQACPVDAILGAANCAAVRDADFRDQLGSIEVRTLVIAGTEEIGRASCRERV